MQLSWLFTLLTGITFLDCTLMIQYGEGITLLSWDWVKTTLDIQDILLGVGLFSFIFAAVLPGFWFIVWPFLLIGISHISNNHKLLNDFPDEDYVRVESLLRKSAKDGNSALLRFCERHEHEVETQNLLSLCSQGMILFTFGAWLFSANGNQPIIMNFYDFWESQPWYIAMPIDTIVGLFCIAIFIMVGMRKNSGSEYVYYPEGEPNKKIKKDAENTPFN